MAAKYESIVIWLINCFIDKKINFQASWFLFGVEYHRINHWMEKLKDFLTYRIINTSNISGKIFLRIIE